MSVLVTCPNGHRFPVNLKKHQNRNYRLCPHPHCGAKVIVKKRFSFLPNPDWTAMKEGYRNAQDKKRKQQERIKLVEQWFGLKGRKRHGRQKA